MARKKIRARKGPKIPLTRSEIEKYIIEANGNFAEAARRAEADFDITISRQKFIYWIEAVGADWIPRQLRRNMVKSCVDTILYKALNKKDNQCLFKIIDKLGRHLDIEDPTQKVEMSHSLAMAFEPYDGKDLKKMRDSE